MKISTIKRHLGIFFVNHLFSGTDAFKTKRALLRFAGYEIGEGTKIVGPLFVSTQLHIGRDCWIGKNFTCNGNGRVFIGDNCDIGPEVIFQTGGHVVGTQERRAGKGHIFTQKVGNGTWIGGRSTIIGETEIGASCVVAGCACVTKRVDDNVMVGGVPAKVIKQLPVQDQSESGEAEVEAKGI